MTVIVTGASGFVGGHVARSLADQGHRVLALNRSNLPAYKGITHLKTDLSARIPHIKEPVDVIIHAAALADYDAPYEVLYQANVVATKNVMAVAKHLKVKKFIHLSSASVYQEFSNKRRVEENYPLVSVAGNNYAQTKRMAEEVVNSAVPFPVICLRPHIVYGPGDTTVLPTFLSHVRGNTVRLPISHSGELSVTHVDTLRRVIEFFVHKKSLKKGFQVFNVADLPPVDCVTFISRVLKVVDPQLRVQLVPANLGYLVATLAEVWAHLSRQRPLLTRDVVHQLNHDSSLSLEALQAVGFKQFTSLDNGLKSLALWVRKFPDRQTMQTQASTVWPGVKLPKYRTINKL